MKKILFVGFRIIWSCFILFIIIATGNFVWVNSIGSRKMQNSEFESSKSVNFYDNPNSKNIFGKSEDNSLQKLLSKKNPVVKKIELPILMYHHIDTVPTSLQKDAVAVGLRVAPDILEKQLQFLQKNNYHTINSFELNDYLSGEFELPTKSILLTFDDGYKDNFENAFRLLQKYNMKGDFAIITGVVGTGEYMSWDNIKTMLNSGMSVSSHTINHCTLAVKDTKNPKIFLDSPEDSLVKPCSKFGIQEKLTTGQIREELSRSKKDLENNLGIKVSHLVYPFGNYNPQVAKIAKDVGYNFATSVKPQVDGISDFENPFELTRIRVNGQQAGELNGFLVK
jgi:peptidoglycan/xylan/chitin deacetylase (PgdA/CDA1 family)